MILKILFWLHLAAGSLAGIVIFIMWLTGVLLATQSLTLPTTRLSGPRPRRSRRGCLENLLAKAVESGRGVPSTLTIRRRTGIDGWLPGLSLARLRAA